MSSPTRATSSSSTRESRAVYLPPGLLFASKDPGAVTTVLGSCVAVCLFDPGARAGGINHYLLPFWNGEGLASPKYANVALPKLVERLIGLGCHPRGLRAKLFGGASVFQQVGGLYGVGQRNVAFAEQYLAEAGIPVLARDVGEWWTRKVIFHVHTGEAFVRRIRPQGAAPGGQGG
jgi:chemotaxis protein CheD